MTIQQKKNNALLHDPVALLRECARIIDDKKGEDIILLDISKVNSYLDYFVIATGNSLVHCRAIARALIKELAQRQVSLNNNADLNSGWIILDYGDIIIHLFTEELREFYNLERLWGDGERIPLR